MLFGPRGGPSLPGAWTAVLLWAIFATVAFRAAPRSFDRFEVEETHRIRITNRMGGAIEVSPDRGTNWLQIGTVTRPARRLAEGYAATRWSRDGTVCATAVHGLRIRVRQSAISDRGLVLAVVPKEFANPPPGFGGFSPGGGGIYTDVPAGATLFRNLAPYVGNEVSVQRGAGLQSLPRDYVPEIGDTLVIVVARPVDPPQELVFENRAGGAATAEFPDGTSVLIGRVLRPVRGVGRFDATGYTGVGCINTNHSGVITISTAPDHNGQPLFDDPFGETRGGFMIQPQRHAEAEGYPIDQVMVVGPAEPSAPPLEGRAPLFYGFLGLQFQSRDPEKSYMCSMRVDDGPWEPLPEYVGRNATLFEADGLARYYRERGERRTIRVGATAFRITFPGFHEDATAWTDARGRWGEAMRLLPVFGWG